MREPGLKRCRNTRKDAVCLHLVVSLTALDCLRFPHASATFRSNSVDLKRRGLGKGNRTRGSGRKALADGERTSSRRFAVPRAAASRTISSPSTWLFLCTSLVLIAALGTSVSVSRQLEKFSIACKANLARSRSTPVSSSTAFASRSASNVLIAKPCLDVLCAMFRDENDVRGHADLAGIRPDRATRAPPAPGGQRGTGGCF